MVALCQPTPGSVANLGYRGGVQAVQRHLIAIGIAVVHLAFGQHPGLAGKATDLLQTTHHLALDLDLGALELFCRGAIGQESRNFLVDRLLDCGDRHAGLDVGLDEKHARQFQHLRIGACTVGDLIAIDQTLVEPGGFAATEDARCHLHVVGVRRAALGVIPDLVQSRLSNAVVHHLAGTAGARGHPGFQAGQRRAGRNIAEILLYLGPGGGHIDVTGQHQRGVGGTVIGVEPRLDVVQRGRRQILHRADRFPAVGMTFREAGLLQSLHDAAVGLVLALALFVLDHAALLVQRRLINGSEQMAHAIGFHPQGHVQRRLRHRLEIVGAIQPGGAVHVGGADLLEGLEILAVVVLGLLEHQMFEQMRETRVPGFLVLGAHVVPHRHRDHRRLGVLVHDHGQAVVELEFFVGNQRIGRRRGSAEQQGRKAGNQFQAHGWVSMATDAGAADARRCNRSRQWRRGR